MSKSNMLFVCLFVLIILQGTTLAAETIKPLSNTLIITDTPGAREFNLVCERLKSSGFVPYHKFPPRAIIGYDPGSVEEISNQRIPGVILITRDYVAVTEKTGRRDEEKMIINTWNTMLERRKGLIPESIQGEDEIHEGRGPDFIIPDSINEEYPLPGSDDSSILFAPAEAPFGAGFYDTTEFYIGDVVVTVICPESDGSRDSNVEDWTSAEETTITNRVVQAFDQIMSEEGRGFITYTYDFRYQVPTSYEAVTRWSSSQSTTWISEIMDNYGYGSYASAIAKTHAFCNDQRDFYDTHWAHVIYMVDVSNTGPQRAYAYLGGPYNLNDNEDSYTVIMHETGHIWYALDEYSTSSCTCTRRAGYLNIDNQNCQNGPCLIDISCRMINNSPPYCKYSQGQIGWSDTDHDGLPDVIDTFPETSLVPYTPDPSPVNILTYMGSATVVPLPNKNPMGFGNDISINTISGVEYRIDSGAWLPAAPVDSVFDGPVEDFTFTTTALMNGTHLIETRAKNNYGNIETTYAYDYVTILAAAPTALPSPTGTWYTPTIVPSPTPTPNFTDLSGSATPTPISGSTHTPIPTPTDTPKPQSFPFCDSFEDGLHRWVINTGASGTVPYVAADNTLEGGLSPVDGSYVAYLGDRVDKTESQATMDLVIDLAGRTNVVLDFWWVVYNGKGKDGIQLDVYDGSWHTDVNGWKYKNSIWEHRTLDLDAGYNMINGFIIRFHSNFAYVESSEASYVDAVCVFDPTYPTPSIIPTQTPTPSFTPTYTPTGPTLTPTATPAVGIPGCPYYIDMASDPGWTLEGGWEFGVPQGLGGTQAGFPDPESGKTGENVLGYNLEGDYPNDIPERYYVTTTPFDCSILENVTLTFWRYLNIEGYLFDQATVEVSIDGVQWFEIWHNDIDETTEYYWHWQAFDISSLADGAPALYVRWGLGPTDDLLHYSGFNIDDVAICGDFVATGTPTSTPTMTVSVSPTSPPLPIPTGSMPVYCILFMGISVWILFIRKK